MTDERTRSGSDHAPTLTKDKTSLETKADTTYPTLDACVYHEIGRLAVPGAAVGLLRDGVVETFGYGVTSLETKQPVTPDTLFQIGSISKVFTATVLMNLVDAGMVDLDAPVSRLLPDLRLGDEAAVATITPRHLLTHTSGLDGDRFDDYGSGEDALSKAIAEFPTLRQVSPPGELWTYCNAGFTLLGAVIEGVLGRGFEASMKERLFDPLGLERSFFFAHEAITYPVAVGHSQEPNAAPEVARLYPLPRAVNAAGGIIGTVGDLLRFAALHLQNGTIDGTTVLEESSAKEMREPQVKAANFAESYGLGWALRWAADTAIVGHGGSTNGFQAQLTVVPDKDFAVAVLTNSGRGTGAIRGIESWALAHYCDLVPKQPASVDLPAERLARFVGRYRQPHADVSVIASDGGLRIEVTVKSPLTQKETALPPMVLGPIGDHEFVVTEGEAATSRVDFLPTSDAVPRFIRLGGRLAERVDTAGTPSDAD